MGDQREIILDVDVDKRMCFEVKIKPKYQK